MQNGVETGDRSAEEQAHVVPPLNFGCVDVGVYRSGQPMPNSFSFIHSLGLKTIVWISPNEPSPDFLSFALSNGIALHMQLYPPPPPSSSSSSSCAAPPAVSRNPEDTTVNDPSNYAPLTAPMVADALARCVDTTQHPLLLCSGMGRYRTGVAVACLRRLQGWNLASTLAEFRRYLGGSAQPLERSSILAANEALVEGFDGKGVLFPADPVCMPRWLYGVVLKPHK